VHMKTMDKKEMT